MALGVEIGEFNHGAIAPQPLERVKLAILRMLHVDHDVTEVDQDPP